MRRIKKNSPQTLYAALKGRMAWVSLFLMVYVLALGGRLVYLQLFQHQALLSQSNKQYMRTVEIFTGRGFTCHSGNNRYRGRLSIEVSERMHEFGLIRLHLRAVECIVHLQHAAKSLALLE